MFGAIISKSGTFLMFLQDWKSIYFNVSNRHLCKKKKKKNDKKKLRNLLASPK
jgi:hypothetical protein